MMFLKSFKFYSHVCYASRTNLLLKFAKSFSNETSNISQTKLSAYVSHPHSYAFGRSDKQLKYITIGELLTQKALIDNKYPRIVSHHENIGKTFPEFETDVNKLAKSLYTELGLKKGDVIGCWSCNCYSWMVIQYACARVGVILCTINPVYRAHELDYALRKGQIKALFMPGIGSKQDIVNQYQKIIRDESISKPPSNQNDDPLLLKDIILIDGENTNADIIKGVRTHMLENLMGNDGNIEPSITEQVCADDPAIIMYTSGTTGKPKGAVSSHYTLVNNALLAGDSFSHGVSGDSQKIICCPLPLFHSFAAVLAGITLTAMPFTTLVLTGYKYDLKAIIESMCNNSCTHIMCTPTIIIDILNYVEKKGIGIPSLRGVLAGGAPVPVEVAHRISKVFPNCSDVRIGYGATELGICFEFINCFNDESLGPCTTACHPTDPFTKRMETVGTPLDFVEVKIVNPVTGQVTNIGEQGELLSRGHNVMIGYWRDEAKTKESIDSGKWYKSGDLAVMDSDGYVKIVGRTKEMIIKGGENIYPREVEELLHTHPNILDAYVIGVPDERMGEEVCAWILLKDKNTKVSEDEIKKFCKENISYFKVPRYVLFVDEFPLTATGKAKKFIMREKSCEILGLKELK